MTVSTVGYGDIIPQSELSRISIMLLILIELILIPKQMNELSNLMSLESSYARTRYKKIREIPHVIVCGKFDVDTLYSFSKEIFHDDHGNSDKHAVIIDRRTPDLKMDKFLNDQRFEIFLTYLKGNPLSENDLKKVKILEAESVSYTYS